MRRTTVKISEELDTRLRREADRRGITVSELVREAIETHLSGPRPEFLSIGAGASTGPPDERDLDEILRDILVADYRRQQAEFEEDRARDVER